jgi:hypothetical protein
LIHSEKSSHQLFSILSTTKKIICTWN